MGVLTGIGGAVDGSDTVRTWRITSEADLQAYVASNTLGAEGQILGNKDWSGQYTAYGHSPARLPGEVFTFTGDMSSGLGATGQVICDEVEIVCDIESGAIIAHTVNFSGDSILTKGAAAAADSVVPFPPTSIGCKVQQANPAASPSWESNLPVRGWTLRLRTDNQEYVDSDTAGGVKRKKGNLSGEVILPFYVSDTNGFAAPLPQDGDYRFLKLFVDATTFWEIWGVQFGSMSDAVIDIEAGTMVGASLNAAFTGTYLVSSTATRGKILEPDTTQYWPFA